MTQVMNSSRAVDLFRSIARRKPHAEALRHGSRAVSYGELLARSLQLARALLARGAKPGDRIGILARNRPEYVEIYFAMQLAGLIAVPVNFRLAPPEIAYVLSNSGAAGLIVAEEFVATVAAIRAELPSLQTAGMIVMGEAGAPDSTYEAMLAREDAEPFPPPVAATAPAAIFYTSGTTGFPKGAVLSGLNILQRIVALGWELGVGEREVMLVPGPLFHMSFSFMSIIPLCIGGRAVIMDAFEPAQVLDTMVEQSVTRSFMVPKMLSLVLEEMRRGRPARGFAIQNLLSSGSALPRDVFDGLREVFPGVRVAESMGWTESNWIVLCPHDDLLRKTGSAGRAAFGSEVAILDDEGRELPSGTIGQIYAACPVQFLGYHNNPQATAAMRRGRWETGGDMGYLDEEGFLFILDRRRDMIISGGENIYPAELERTLSEHPAVLEVAVVGVSDPTWGEAPRACVVTREGASVTAADLIGFCDGKLARYKQPRSVVFIDELPRNSMGKILRRELRERFAAEGTPS